MGAGFFLPLDYDGYITTSLDGGKSFPTPTTGGTAEGGLMRSRLIHYSMVLFPLAIWLAPSQLPAETCESVVKELNATLNLRVDEQELVSIFRTLNETGNQKLPPKFVTKNRAKKLGWKPGRDLWEYRKLEGKSIGGDIFSNREGNLPDGKRTWHEADLDYQGGHRGPKRIIYSSDGLRGRWKKNVKILRSISAKGHNRTTSLLTAHPPESVQVPQRTRPAL